MKKKNKYKTLLVSAALLALFGCGCGKQASEEELAYRTLGIESMEAGDYEGAVAAFEAALQGHIGWITKTEIDISYYKAAAQYAAGDKEGALATYDAILDYDKEDGNAYYMRGCLLLGQGDSEAALSDFSAAVNYNSEDYELYVSIYENLSAYGLAEQGEAYLNKAFGIKGNSADNLAWRGKLYSMLGQYDNAKKELSAALEKGSALANLYLAKVYEAEGDMERAQTLYQTYLELGEESPEAMNALAELEIQRGNYAQALLYVNQGLSMKEVPNRKELMQNQILACEYTGDFAGAWAAVQEYMALYPEDSTMQREYTFLKYRQGFPQGQEEIAPEGEP